MKYYFETVMLRPLLSRLIYLLSALRLKHNGPAIWGGCVTRRSIRAGSRYFSQKAVTVQGGYGAVFAIQVQVLWNITRVAVQVWSEPVNYHGAGFLLGALAQCRGTKLIEARKLSRYTGFKLRADARVRVHEPLHICLRCRSKSKNCDEQLTHIVRVMRSWYFLRFWFGISILYWFQVWI